MIAVSRVLIYSVVNGEGEYKTGAGPSEYEWSIYIQAILGRSI